MFGIGERAHIKVKYLAILAIMAPLFSFAVASGGVASAQDAAKLGLGSIVATIAQTELKDQPLDSGTKLLDMPVNAQAIVLGGPFNDGWYWLNFNSTPGYVQAKYLVLVDANYKPVAEATATVAATATTATTAPSPAATDTPSTVAIGTPLPLPTPSDGVTIPSTPGDYTGLWLAEMSKAGSVRAGPGFDQKIIKGWWVGRRVLLYQAVPDGKVRRGIACPTRRSSRCGCTAA